ncbi:MAG TPA: helicase-exonuclease AddAB subunit AddB [Bacillota bacterium]|nr:helicase-exonuclease AddAB subunit AddB [Bacillota bacterium]HPX68545.1 helicase-exonuclease AddAB subunit AddB [Bacillota bacterium]HQO42155.1 helicase-exonuclease AddAB subunit AddB [Bacillota bacterium]HQQ43947.1 helicase-exonuclease AddAB subunit AddB [Bacillota bacterium]
MSLRIIYGRAGSGKSTYCLNEIRESLNQGNNTRHIIIVPEQFSLQAEKKLIKAVGASGINGAEVLSFRRLSHRVLGEVGGLVRKHINPAGKSILVYTIMEKLRDELRVFAKAAGKQGFVNTLCGTISELKRYNIAPPALGSIETASLSPQLADKLHDIGLIYGEFEKRLHDKYIDSDDDLDILAEKLELYKAFETSEIWLDEFSGFTPQEYGVIAKLMSKAVRVNVLLCTDCLSEDYAPEDTDPFLPARAAAAKLIRLAKDSGIKVDAPVSLKNNGFKFNKELAFLESNFYSYLHGKYKESTEHLKLYEAPGIFAEAESAARDILKKCREEGFRYRDIAVITGDLPQYEKVIRVVFREHGIPCFIDRKKDITGHPLILLVLSALEIFIGNWSYEAVFRYLKTGLTGIDRRESDILENYVLANYVPGSSWMKDEDWEGLSVNEARRRAAAPLLRLYGRIKGKNTVKEICTALFDFLCELEVPEKLEMLVEHFTQRGELDRADEYSQVWNILLELLDQVVEAIGDEAVKADTFLTILSVGFGEYNIGLIPPALEQVLVGSLERSKSHDVKAIYVLGANDGIFPVPFKQEGILSDRDREILRNMGMELAPDTRGRTFEQQHLIYTALTASSDYLRLSWCAADREGRAQRPSVIISRLRRMFPEISFESGILRGISGYDADTNVSAPVPTFNELVSAMRQGFEGRYADPLWKSVADWYKKEEQWKEKYFRIAEGLSYTNQAGFIRQERIRKIYGKTIHTSVSRLERYFSCPFSYYVEYGLKAKERPVMKMNAPDMGSFMHRVIDMFSRKVSESDLGWRHLEREWCAGEVSLIVDELVQDAAGKVFLSTNRYKYLAARLKRVLTRAVWLIAEHIKRSAFEPVGYEIGFGEGEEFPAIELELPSGEKMSLSGRIDRLDCMETEEGKYFRIVDYKSGSRHFKLEDVYYGLQLQLITYLDAVGGSLEEEPDKPVLPAGVLYFRLDDPIIQGSREASEEEIEKAIMKELRMKGLLLADVKVIKEMDTGIDGDSLIIPARINKGDVLGRSSAATAEQFEIIKRHVRKLLLSLGEEILKGNISISPYRRKKMTACAYCSYMPVCQFDMSISGNNYRNLWEKKDEEIWELMAGKTVEGGEANGLD